MVKEYFLLVIGGGAAGIFAAVNAARLHREKKILVLEKSNKLLSKVSISGGGRCNVTHACFDPKLLVQNYPRGKKELQGPFSRFHAEHTIQWFEQRGVKLKTEADGRVFPVSDNSEDIIQCLLQEAKKYEVEIFKSCGVKEIIMEENGFKLLDEKGNGYFATNVLIATGGSSQMRHYEWISSLGHSIIAPVPSLFTFNLKPHLMKDLMGLSVLDVEVGIKEFKEKNRGPLLVTHWGLSGPAVLKLSSLTARFLKEKDYQYEVSVNWLPDYKLLELQNKILELKLNKSTGRIINAKVFDELPARLWEFFCAQSGISSTMNWADLSNKSMNVLINSLHQSTFFADGKTTFKEEFVTCGGVDLKEIDLKTMESKLHKGLYFAGEIVNIDGITGGFNFQAAWTSGYIAAASLRE